MSPQADYRGRHPKVGWGGPAPELEAAVRCERW